MHTAPTKGTEAPLQAQSRGSHTALHEPCTHWRGASHAPTVQTFQPSAQGQSPGARRWGSRSVSPIKIGVRGKGVFISFPRQKTALACPFFCVIWRYSDRGRFHATDGLVSEVSVATCLADRSVTHIVGLIATTHDWTHERTAQRRFTW